MGKRFSKEANTRPRTSTKAESWLAPGLEYEQETRASECYPVAGTPWVELCPGLDLDNPKNTTFEKVQKPFKSLQCLNSQLKMRWSRYPTKGMQ